MKAALVAVVGAALIALNSATFYYVKEVEHRLTALEVRLALAAVRPVPAPKLEALRLGARPQPVHDGE